MRSHAARGIRRYTPEQVARQAEMLANRVSRRFAHLARHFAREGVEAFRLYDRDIPEVRAVVDWYAGHLVVAEYIRQQTGPEWLPAMGRAVAEALGVPAGNLHLKRRRTGRGTRYGRLASLGERIVVRERDLRFLVNLTDHIDTGLFSDHRDTRALVRRMASGTRFLNLFGYTGTFTCAAVAGGAAATVTVDRSATYLRWARDNLDLNGLAGPAHALVRADAMEYLEACRRLGRRFTLAVVDPPSFSDGRGGRPDFDVQRDHPLLLRQVLAVMEPGGVVLFSTNHQRFAPRFEDLEEADVEEITAATLPPDYRHPGRRAHRCWRLLRLGSPGRAERPLG